MNSPLQSKAISIDAPIEGWDAYHSLDNMPPTAAVILNNIIPDVGSVKTREGHILFTELPGVTGQVQTVASLDNEAGSILVACGDGGIWRIDDTPVEVSAQVVENLAPLGTFTVDKWQTENFRKADESGIMVMCNGVDTPQIVYEQTPGAADWAIKDIVTTGTQPPLAYPDDDPPVPFEPTFIGCLSYKGRMYYWEDNDNAFYYTQAGSYQGEFRKFDLGSFAQRGGKIVLLTTWTQQDSGDGKDDFFVAVFSTGEVIVYQGDDPDTVGYWEFVGRYVTAEPLSIRGVTQYGADTILMTQDGYIALSTLIQQGRISDVPAFSRLITDAIKQRTQFFGEAYGWDVELHAKKGLMLFNVPLGPATFEQHVINTVTQRWCKFVDWPINCLEVHDERLFAGSEEGRVLALLETTADNGDQINFTALPAFNYLDNPGYQKHLTACQIQSTHPSPSYYEVSGHADFNFPTLTVPSLPPGSGHGTWSIEPATPPQSLGSFWDEDYWAPSTLITTQGWQNVSAYGFAVTVLVQFALVNDTVEWRSTNLRYHVAGAQ